MILYCLILLSLLTWSAGVTCKPTQCINHFSEGLSTILPLAEGSQYVLCSVSLQPFRKVWRRRWRSRLRFVGVVEVVSVTHSLISWWSRIVIPTHCPSLHSRSGGHTRIRHVIVPSHGGNGHHHRYPGDFDLVGFFTGHLFGATLFPYMTTVLLSLTCWLNPSAAVLRSITQTSRSHNFIYFQTTTQFNDLVIFPFLLFSIDWQREGGFITNKCCIHTVCSPTVCMQRFTVPLLTILSWLSLLS